MPEWSEADLIWRTSGEQRLSNYMTWQAAYSEFVFSDVLWPDVILPTCGPRSRSTRAGTGATAPPEPAHRQLPDATRGHR